MEGVQPHRSLIYLLSHLQVANRFQIHGKPYERDLKPIDGSFTLFKAMHWLPTPNLQTFPSTSIFSQALK